jgi:hypothetical protein
MKFLGDAASRRRLPCTPLDRDPSFTSGAEYELNIDAIRQFLREEKLVSVRLPEEEFVSVRLLAGNQSRRTIHSGRTA